MFGFVQPNKKSQKTAPHRKTTFSYEVLPFEVIEQKYLMLFQKFNMNMTLSKIEIFAITL